ncbi:MAG: glycosyltransferase [Gammaproteobacteria bacterium]|nr:glycosyltransferase [Gammaproteobacteria bacterium]
MSITIAVVTSIHPDFDARIWKHVVSLSEAGIKVHFISPWDFQDVVTPESVSVHPFRRVTRRSMRPFLIPKRVFGRLRSCWRDVDLIHFHDIDLLPWMAIASFFKPVVYDCHENYPDEMLVREWIPNLARRPLYHVMRIGQRALARIVGHCVLVAESQEPDFTIDGVDFIYIKNYASRRLLNSVADDYESRVPTVVFTGGHHDTNGSGLLLDIAERCGELLPDLRFIATDRFTSPEYRARFEAQLNERGLARQFELVPFVPSQRIMTVLNRGTIGVSPNLRTKNQEKAIPTKLFEYMAAGLPIVSSDLPNQTHIINDARCGLLARPEDKESFVRAIQHLVDDRGSAKALGESGKRAFAQRYCWEEQIPALLDLYGAILERRGSPAEGRLEDT